MSGRGVSCLRGWGIRFEPSHLRLWQVWAPGESPTPMLQRATQYPQSGPLLLPHTRGAGAMGRACSVNWLNTRNSPFLAGLSMAIWTQRTAQGGGRRGGEGGMRAGAGGGGVLSAGPGRSAASEGSTALFQDSRARCRGRRASKFRWHSLGHPKPPSPEAQTASNAPVSRMSRKPRVWPPLPYTVSGCPTAACHGREGAGCGLCASGDCARGRRQWGHGTGPRQPRLPLAGPWQALKRPPVPPPARQSG